MINFVFYFFPYLVWKKYCKKNKSKARMLTEQIIKKSYVYKEKKKGIKGLAQCHK